MTDNQVVPDLEAPQKASGGGGGKFTIKKEELEEVADKAQNRKFSEEIDLLDTNGGLKWLEEGLKTDFQQGLNQDEFDFRQRDQAYGNNKKPQTEMKGIIELMCEALQDETLRILQVAAVVSIIIETGTADESHRSSAWVEGFAIIVAILVCASVTAINDYQKERQFKELNSVADARKTVSVLRGGEIKILHQSLVLVGDVIQLNQGMEIPADGIVLQASELTTDESAMTGETDPIKKNVLEKSREARDKIIADGARDNATSHDVPGLMIMSGTRILTGEGQMVVIVVGDSSCVGKISKLLRQGDPEATPLQKQLEAIANDIGTRGLYSALLIVLVLMIRFAAERGSEEKWDHSQHWAELVNFFIIGVTVVVVAIPEGLPLSVTLSLAYSVKKMLKDNNLVRKMQACETMGGADCICSDKTGTLTMNKMTVQNYWSNTMDEFPVQREEDREIKEDEEGDDKSNKSDGSVQEKEEAINFEQKEKPLSKLEIKDFITNQDYLNLFIINCACNSSALLRPQKKGSKTEIAMLEFIERCGFKYQDLRKKYKVKDKFPFSSARKRMGIILELVPGSNNYVIFEKGASEQILKICTHYHGRDGTIKPIDETLKAEIEKNIQEMADKALRTICIAYQQYNENEDMVTKDKLGIFNFETFGFTLNGIFGIRDPVRPQVPKALEDCRRAGIQVRMVTGDNQDTARAIAKDCQIIMNDDDIVMEGPEFIERTGGVVCKNCQIFKCDCEYDKATAQKRGVRVRIDTIKNKDEFNQIIDQLCVMARSRPEDKYALVTGLIEKGHVVAVTGDGTNDAPALQQADVGFAMGIAGTEVAREAAAIILLDDNFQSIVAAVSWGRNIYDSIKKFLQFQLTVNVCAVVSTLVSAAILKQEVLVPIQMLWINLIMDTFASLALATEPPVPEQLHRKPHKRDEYIITQKMFKHIFGQAVYQLFWMFFILFYGEYFLYEFEDEFDDQLKTSQVIFDEWWQSKYSDAGRTLIRPGRFNAYNGIDQEYSLVEYQYGVPSRHYTYIFNVFVMCQIFNFINSRQLSDEVNVLGGIQQNPMFVFIVIFIIIGQIILVTFAGTTFHCYIYYGLTGLQWLICVAIGAGCLIWSVILKMIPEDMCFQTGKQQVDPLLHGVGIRGSQQRLTRQLTENQLPGVRQTSNK